MVAIEPLAYRTIIGTALQALRPRVEMIVVESDALLAEVPRLKPGLVISEFSRPSESSEIAWIEFRPYTIKPSPGLCTVSGVACSTSRT